MDLLEWSLRLSLPFWVAVDIPGGVDVDEAGGEVVFGAGELEAEDVGLGVVDPEGEVGGGGGFGGGGGEEEDVFTAEGFVDLYGIGVSLRIR